MLYLTNAFSINMLNMLDAEVRVSIAKIDGPKVVDIIQGAVQGVTNAIGHQDTATAVSLMLEEHGFVPPPAQRLSIKIGPHDEVIVAQYTGERLPPGATTLPEQGKFSWFLVRIIMPE